MENDRADSFHIVLEPNRRNYYLIEIIYLKLCPLKLTVKLVIAIPVNDHINLFISATNCTKKFLMVRRYIISKFCWIKQNLVCNHNFQIYLILKRVPFGVGNKASKLNSFYSTLVAIHIQGILIIQPR